MTKKDLLSKLAERTNLSIGVADLFLETLSAVTQEALVAEDTIPLPGIGKLITKERDARQYKHPHTQKMMTLPAKTVVVFKPSSELKSLLSPNATDMALAE